MQVLSTARSSSASLYALAAPILMGAVTVAMTLGYGWQHSIYYRAYGAAAILVFYAGMTLATVLNLSVFFHRKSYVAINEGHLKVAGERPIRLADIDRVEIGRGALLCPTLRISSKRRRIPISSLMATTGLIDLKEAIEAHRLSGAISR